MAESFTAADLADCVEREVRQRQRAYPRWVENGRMTQQLADRQTTLMQAIARKLRAEADAEGAKDDLFGRNGGVLEVRSPAPAQKHRGEHPQAQAENEQSDHQSDPADIGDLVPGEEQQDHSDERKSGES
jgi:hypothetical protein